MECAEPLVDCDWWNGQLECIEQEGVNCKRPVSQHAIIDIPEKFAFKAGRFKCKTYDRHEDSKTCEFIHGGGKQRHCQHNHLSPISRFIPLYKSTKLLPVSEFIMSHRNILYCFFLSTKISYT